MKRLLLMRHAKADPGEADHDRDLAPRGGRDAADVGRTLVQRGWQPDFALVSDARRTRRTYAGLFLPADTPVRFEPRLYEASPDTVLACIAEAPDDAGTLLVVGHNPGIALAARRLAGDGDASDLARLRGSFPTSTVAVLALPDAPWSALAAEGARLEALLWTNTADA